ncbi:MAG: hypothetical protein H6744_18305 [Deltaproteobacteria bacterium]|nr:hypothetical protein [Deltaproteobacteria bacterium]
MHRLTSPRLRALLVTLCLLPWLGGCDGGGSSADAAGGDTDTIAAGPCTTTAECQAGAGSLEPCQISVCDTKKGRCVVQTAPEHATCDDGDPCTVESWCIEGACDGASVVKPDCDDGNPCTGDGCQPGVGCVHSNITAPCNDGNSCTNDDACAAGACQGQPTAQCSCSVDANCEQFEDDNLCNGTLRCVLGQCQVDPASLVDCPPAAPCQRAACDPATGACSTVAADDGEPCSDGSGCTTNDACEGGQCKGAGLCACEQDDDCAVFEDGDACNGVLICSAGVCIIDSASVPDCTDEIPGDCLEVSCDPATGECATEVTADGTPCALGDLCFSGGACLEGACAGGVEKDCDDGNECTLDLCVANVGCEHQPAQGKTCDDGDPCTSGDVCQGVVCVGPTNACVCGDGFCATTESCESCPNDCGSCCGNAVCDAGENPGNCAQDCGGQGTCGDGFCDSGAFEELSCPQDCPASGVCGDGNCDAGSFEQFTCPQDCPTNATCGFLCDGVCDNMFDVLVCPSDCSCGNGTCEGDETPECCAADCGPVCGDGTCDADEDETSCPDDCTPVVADPMPDAAADEAPEAVETVPDAGGDVAEPLGDVAEPTPDADSDADAGEVGPMLDADVSVDVVPDVVPDTAGDTVSDADTTPGPDAEPDAEADMTPGPDTQTDAAADTTPGPDTEADTTPGAD